MCPPGQATASWRSLPPPMPTCRTGCSLFPSRGNRPAPASPLSGKPRGRRGRTRARTLPPPVLRLRQLAVALAPAEPFAVQGPAAVTVVKGYPTSVGVTVTRAAKQTALAVEVTGVVPAPTALSGL